ncbi:DUF1996 domain-containing protein [Ilumatobacter sp.]|uniref:DUF1996 domain-containing protein n=1 Tax=Ilumatobacter sp. TaxID=1967498 RepID=UPI003B51E1E7
MHVARFGQKMIVRRRPDRSSQIDQTDGTRAWAALDGGEAHEGHTPDEPGRSRLLRGFVLVTAFAAVSIALVALLGTDPLERSAEAPVPNSIDADGHASANGLLPVGEASAPAATERTDHGSATDRPATSNVRPVTDPESVAFIESDFDVEEFLVETESLPASSATEPSGNFRLICQFSHLAYDDPIVHPGEAGRSHLHMFFGNTAADASSDYDRLRTSGESTCQGGSLNRSAYWAPAVIDQDGDVRVPDFISVYYKGPGHGVDGELTDVVALPAGLRMIAGQRLDAPLAESPHDWYCELDQEKSDTIPDCGPDEHVGVVLPFPTCWNGIELDSPDHRSHVAEPVRDEASGQLSCPSTHPTALPQLTVGIWFSHDGDSSGWHLASDRSPGGPEFENGASFHSDWFGAWDPEIQRRWTELCINDLLNCEGGELGDGTRLSDIGERVGPSTMTAPSRP